MLTIPPDIKCCLSILNIDYQDDFPPDVMCCLHILIQRSASYDMCANKEQRSTASWVKLNVLYDLIKQLRIKCVELHENSWCRWLRSRLLCVNFNNIMSIIDHLKKKTMAKYWAYKLLRKSQTSKQNLRLIAMFYQTMCN